MSVFLCVDRDGWTNSLQLSLEYDNGTGYRLAGPKYNGSSTNLLRRKLTLHDCDELAAAIKKVRKEEKDS